MRAPLERVRVTPHGAWGYYRSSSGRRHAGVDLGAKRGTPVFAPERMTVLSVATDNATRPLSGYGPGAIEALGDSGAIHVMGHLESDHGVRVGDVIEEGARVGAVSSKGHVHWEVRKPDREPWPRATRIADTYDPVAWLESVRKADDAPGPSYNPVEWLRETVRKADDGARDDVRKPDSSAIVILALLLLAHAHR